MSKRFLPTVTRWSRWKDRKKKIDWPLFPGYCFARFNARERLPILEVQRRGEHHFVRRGTRANPGARDRRDSSAH
jgi:hypothetical protein